MRQTCQREQAEEKKALSNARYDVEGETLRTNFWTRSSNGYQTHDSIHEFQIESETDSATRKYETRPRHMAQMARDYHNTVQAKDLPEEYGRLMATEMVKNVRYTSLKTNTAKWTKNSLVKIFERPLNFQKMAKHLAWMAYHMNSSECSTSNLSKQKEPCK
jgi:hypothetical protein